MSSYNAEMSTEFCRLWRASNSNTPDTGGGVALMASYCPLMTSYTLPDDVSLSPNCIAQEAV